MKKRQRKPYTIEGLPVVDAKHDLHIQIQPNDVKQSKKADPANCAAAVACRRKFKTEVRVYLTKTFIKERKHWVRYSTPQAISREIVSFDRSSIFEPGDYKLNRPAPAARLGMRKPTGPKETSGKPRHYHHITKNVRSYKDQSK